MENARIVEQITALLIRHEHPPQRPRWNPHHRPAAGGLSLIVHTSKERSFLSQNDQHDAARQYHSGTKHSYLSLRMHPHALDWENKPLLFKIYPTLEVTRLPRDFRKPESLRSPRSLARARQSRKEAVPDVDMLAQLLFFSAGVIRSKKHAQGETFFRAAACTGALYEIELYIVCTDLPGKDTPGAVPCIASRRISLRRRGVWAAPVARWRLSPGDSRQHGRRPIVGARSGHHHLHRNLLA